MIKSELQLEQEFAPDEFEAFHSLDEHLSSQPNPSSTAPRAEEALSNCKHMMKIIYLLVTCYKTMCIIHVSFFRLLLATTTEDAARFEKRFYDFSSATNRKHGGNCQN